MFTGRQSKSERASLLLEVMAGLLLRSCFRSVSARSILDEFPSKLLGKLASHEFYCKGLIKFYFPGNIRHTAPLRERELSSAQKLTGSRQHFQGDVASVSSEKGDLERVLLGGQPTTNNM